ncbi:hypothetical protein AYO45_04790 [Gammaproteobacteria bacterium SCGC AG-212-F23]|nr:hypothetical protein AYO45_04790 [Gammaproteobacteria bacterium SCGC AG-212-F23]
MKKLGICLLIFLNIQFCFAKNTISIDLENVSLADAIRVIAERIPCRVSVKPTIVGSVSLHLKAVSAEETLDLLLASHQLIKHKVDDTWVIEKSVERMKENQDSVQLQESSVNAAPLVTRVWQIHYAKADDMIRLLQDNHYTLLSKRGAVHADTRTNTLCVHDILEHMDEINRLIKRLDIPVQQVLIEARLVNIDHSFERELGMHFSVQNAEAIDSEKNHFSLAVAHLADASLLDVKLAALENEGHGEIISSPSLFTANQQTAMIESGEEIPYQETSRNGATSVAFKKAVLALKVTPQIMPDHKVLLELEVNQDKPSKHVVLGVPAISTRHMSTHVLVKNGQTVVLGGIYEEDQTWETDRIPFLGKIPLVGFLFRQQNSSQGKRKLFIFVTPKIM